MKDSYIKLTT